MTQLREFFKEKERHDFRSKEAKVRIRQINQETDGLETQTMNFHTGLLHSNRETSYKESSIKNEVKQVVKEQ